MASDEVPGAPGEQWYTFTPLLEQLLGGRRQRGEEFVQRHFDVAASRRLLSKTVVSTWRNT